MNVVIDLNQKPAEVELSTPQLLRDELSLIAKSSDIEDQHRNLKEFVKLRSKILAQLKAQLLACHTAQELEDNISQLKEPLTIIIESLKDGASTKTLERYLSTISNSLTALADIYQDKDSPDSEELFALFDDVDIETPHALKERKCEKLVESILDCYGHRNEGENINERRLLKLSRFHTDYVPRSVKELVAKRFVSRDPDLDADHILKDLQRARLETYEHALLLEYQPLRKLFKKNESITPAEILSMPDLSDLLSSSPLLSNLKIAHEAHSSLKSIIEKTLPLIDSLKNIETELNTLHIEQKQRIENEEKAREDQLRTYRWKNSPHSASFFSELIYGIKESKEFKREAIEEIVNFANQEDKDAFVELLLSRSLKHSAEISVLFVELESKSLIEIIRTNPEQALDRCLARFPRLAHLTHATQEDIKEHLYQELESLFKARNFPVWMSEWFSYHKDQLLAGKLRPLDFLPINCAAFGRVEEQHVPYSAALSPERANLK